ncbi:protein lifeguard 1 [Erpetoichthys calabaricus]|uniref:protein lifeguard 1 n=1 Tax=Erpetoichthys calabaricus TaxID=27687 RepID=UPI0010A02E68|nr:protein lifeguard 1 [Erpetoichthys calabaricus]
MEKAQTNQVNPTPNNKPSEPVLTKPATKTCPQENPPPYPGIMAATYSFSNENAEPPTVIVAEAPQSNLPPAYVDGSAAAMATDFTEKVVRRAFIRKVYITLMIQLVITAGIICIFIYWPLLNNWLILNPWFTYTTLPVVLVLAIILACCTDARRKVPLNFILLGLFTVVEGLMLGSVTVFFTTSAVMWAAGATAFVCFSLTIFALQTKWDFTLMAGVMWAVLWSLVSFGILCAIIRSQWLSIVYSAIGTLIFAVYLVLDTQLMLGGKHKYSISPEEYIFAALNLYLDIINLFLFLLRIIGMAR